MSGDTLKRLMGNATILGAKLMKVSEYDVDVVQNSMKDYLQQNGARPTQKDLDAFTVWASCLDI